ncbi:MAG: hypothetical protein IE927_07510, partial [Rhodobacterales bacterium]|nr:hypothetical protein [Rhodobacterales bacterium]
GRGSAGGWAQFDGSVEAGRGAPVTRVEVTWGRHLDDRATALAQLFLTHETEIEAEAATGLVWRLGPAAQLQAALWQPVAGGGGTRLGLSLWLRR